MKDEKEENYYVRNLFDAHHPVVAAAGTQHIALACTMRQGLQEGVYIRRISTTSLEDLEKILPTQEGAKAAKPVMERHGHH